MLFVQWHSINDVQMLDFQPAKEQNGESDLFSAPFGLRKQE